MADTFEVHDPLIEQKLRQIGMILTDATHGTKYGFAFFLFGYENDNMFYISSAERESVLDALQSFINKQRPERK